MKRIFNFLYEKITRSLVCRYPNKDQKKLYLLLKWSYRKDEIHGFARTPKIMDGDIWWAGVGENIGVEINGKNEQYSRPVLILKKLSRHSFMGIPLTSKEKTGSWYVKFTFHKRTSVAVLSQARIMSVYRLYDRMGTLDNKDFLRVKAGFRKLYS